MPNDETPARRGWSVRGHSRASDSSSTAPAVQSTWDEGSSAWSVCGSRRSRSAITILIRPAAPAAACGWPMFDLTEPSHSGSAPARSWPYVAIRACASIGSPSRVPVPCASTASTSDGDIRAAASACRITRCCDGPFGAVRPFDAPSWLTALPRTTASTGCPRRRASDSRSSTSTPAPSAHPVPSAVSAKDLHRPSPASPPCRENSRNMPGFAMIVAPPAKARSHSPARSAWPARCSATSADEHAVSTDTAGPSRPRA